ncbi:MAG: 5'-methylthioadenosine phosphorylase, partial [Casimicrobiaceae bacterium]
FTEPYDAALRRRLLDAAATVGEPVLDRGVYAATQGPRLETAAEIIRLRQDGATVVGMTGMPEAVLARELDLPYAHLCFVVNWAAGLCDSAQAIDLAAIDRTVASCVERVRRVVFALAEAFSRGCGRLTAG